MKISVLFIFFLFFVLSFSDMRNLKNIWCVREYYTYQTTALLPVIFLFWFGVVYELQLTNYGLETVSKDASCFHLATSGASLYVLQVWHI